MILFYLSRVIFTHKIDMFSWQNITGCKRDHKITKLWNNKPIIKHFKIHYKMTISKVCALFSIDLKQRKNNDSFPETKAKK